MHNASDSENPILKPGIPIKPETVDSWDDIKIAWEQIGPCYMQPKYDGWQIQIHVTPQNVALFTRRELKDVTAKFRDVALAARTQITADTAIFDSEVVAYDPNARQLLSLSKTASAGYNNHKAFVFDVLYLNEEDWTVIPYEKRLAKLHEVVQTTKMQIIEPVNDIFAKDFHTMQSFYAKCLEDGFEGVIIKRPDAIYKPGKKTSLKGKVKPRETLDVVVLGCSLATANQVKSLLVGVKKHEKEYVPIGKVDKVIYRNEQNSPFVELWASRREAQQPSPLGEMTTDFFWVEPKLVIEIEVMFKYPSQTYSNVGFTIKKPLLKRIRDDKGPEDINTIEDFLRIRSAPGEKNTPQQISLF